MGGDLTDSIRFLCHKWCALAIYMIPSIFVTIIGILIFKRMTPTEIVDRLPLVFFEIFPMCSFGYSGFYVVGISWYISSMMFALAVLYPACKKYKDKFIFTIGIPMVIFIYGFLCHTAGSLAVNWYTESPAYIPLALLRGLAGCLSGCIIYRLSILSNRIELNKLQRVALIIIECFGYFYLIYACKKHPKSGYDYLLMFTIFFLLLIGISKLTGLHKFYGKLDTKSLGIISTLFVLNHYTWNQCLIMKFGNKFSMDRIVCYFCLIIASSICVYFLSETRNLFKKRWFFYKEQ